MAGKTHRAKGRIKKAAGELTGSRRLKQEGTIEKAAGFVMSAVDRLKRTLIGK